MSKERHSISAGPARIEKLRREPGEEEKMNMPLYPIGIASELLGTTDQTLRLYEKHGLITPSRRNRNRYYSENDILWLRCVRDLIHEKKMSIQGIKKLLEYVACWEIRECAEEARRDCTAFRERSRQCWELKRTVCNTDSGKACESCRVFLLKGYTMRKEGKE